MQACPGTGGFGNQCEGHVNGLRGPLGSAGIAAHWGHTHQTIRARSGGPGFSPDRLRGKEVWQSACSSVVLSLLKLCNVFIFRVKFCFCLRFSFY